MLRWTLAWRRAARLSPRFEEALRKRGLAAATAAKTGAGSALQQQQTASAGPSTPQLTPRNGHASEPLPYADTAKSWTGTHVPVYSAARGLITKRDWTFDGEGWCSVCSEPISQWLTHIGRKDHSLLDAHYNLIADLPGRRWDAQRVLEEAAAPDGGGANSSRLGGPGLPVYQRAYDAAEQSRRMELAAMIGRLVEARAIIVDPRERQANRSHWFGTHLDGHLMIHEHLIPRLTRLFPQSDLPLLCNFEDFISSAYNMETVYDVCGLRAVDPGAESASEAPSQQDVADATAAYGHSLMMGPGADDNSSGNGGEASAGGAEPEIRFSHKANFVRDVLGQLRWCAADRDAPPNVHPDDAGWVAVLGRTCALSLLAELVDARISEYMVRSEQVWHRYGNERRVPVGNALADDPHAPPHESRWDPAPAPCRYTVWGMATGADEMYSLPSDDPTPNTLQHTPPSRQPKTAK